MVKRFTVVLLALTVSLLPAGAKPKSTGFHYITPSAFDRKVDVLVSGKRREYFLLEQDKKVEITVPGPSRLRVLSRVILPVGKDSTGYAYLIRQKNSRKSQTVTHNTRLSDKVMLAGETIGRVSVSRAQTVDIPRGEHTYLFFLPKGSPTQALLKFALETSDFTKGTPVAAMTPNEFTTQVDLVAREETSTYYRIGAGNKIALDLIGPATLKVLARIEFDANMNGKQKWRTQVLEDGKVKGTYSLSATKSDVTTYREPSPLVASRAEAFFVEVPQGTHRYEFLLPENHRTVLLRFLLPKNELVRE